MYGNYYSGYGRYGSSIPAELIAVLVIAAILLLAYLVGWGKVLKKSNRHWATMLVPFYGQYVTYAIADCASFFWINLIAAVVMLIIRLPILTTLWSIAALVMHCLHCYKLASAFEKGIGFTVGLILLNPIFIMILGYGSAQNSLVGNSFYQSSSRSSFWDCSCGHTNGASSLYCESCGKTKPRNYNYSAAPVRAAQKSFWQCSCGVSNSSGAAQCESCGRDKPASAAAERWICPSCGKPNPMNRVYCVGCGATKGSSTAVQSTQVSKWTCSCGKANSFGYSTCPSCGMARPANALASMPSAVPMTTYSAPVRKTRVQPAPASSAPVQPAPASSAPASSAPASSAPVQPAPASSAPASSAPVRPAPSYTPSPSSSSSSSASRPSRPAPRTLSGFDATWRCSCGRVNKNSSLLCPDCGDLKP